MCPVLFSLSVKLLWLFLTCLVKERLRRSKEIILDIQFSEITSSTKERNTTVIIWGGGGSFFGVGRV